MKNKTSWGSVLLLFIILFGVLWTKSNLDWVYAKQADYYFRKNNIPLAQQCYEKAFELGLENSKARDIYVNSIINSPLTIEAQEKLVKFLDYPIEDSAKLKVEYFLYDLKREIYRKYPENFISNAVYNQKVMRWSSSPISYKFENIKDAPEYFAREIENAFTEWEKVTEHRFMFIENEQNPNIIIRFESNNPTSEDRQKFVVAYTVPEINADILKNMEIVFYTKDPLGNNFTNNQVYNTALHEIFHALGFMGHSNDKNHIMYLTKDSNTHGNTLKETITQADINTITLLYKIKPQITNTNDSKSEYIPFLVLGDEKEVNTEKIKEAKIYIKKAPNLPAGYIDLAEGYVAAKDYPKAIKTLEKALQLADNNEILGMIYFNLAITYFYIDHLEMAQSYLKKSMEIEDSEEKHYLLGEIYVRKGDTEKAIKEYSSLIRQNPQNIEYTIALTNIYVINREFIKARKTLKNFVKINPSERNNPRLKPYGILNFGL